MFLLVAAKWKWIEGGNYWVGWQMLVILKQVDLVERGKMIVFVNHKFASNTPMKANDQDFLLSENVMEGR